MGAQEKKKGECGHSPFDRTRGYWLEDVGALLGGLGRGEGQHRDEAASAARAVKVDMAGDHGIKGVIAAHADIFTGMDLGAALADQDIAAKDGFAAEFLDAEATAFGIAPIARGTACFLMRHGTLLL